MEHHGLCTWGKTLEDALNVAEEFEHLAQTALLAQK